MVQLHSTDEWVATMLQFGLELSTNNPDVESLRLLLQARGLSRRLTMEMVRKLYTLSKKKQMTQATITIILLAVDTLLPNGYSDEVLVRSPKVTCAGVCVFVC